MAPEAANIEDTVTLGASPRRLPPTVMPLAPAPGPLGPVLAEQLQELPCKYFYKRRLPMPWQDRHREVTAEEAAELFTQGNERLRVDMGKGPLPLKGEQQLAVLESTLAGSTDRKLEPATELVIRGQCRDAESGRALTDYDAYLQLGAHQPIVVMEDGLPLARLDRPGSRVKPREIDTDRKQSQALRLAAIVDAIADDFSSLPSEVLTEAPLDPSERKLVNQLKKNMDPARVAGFLRIFDRSQDLEASVQSLVDLGYDRDDVPLSLARSAHDLLLKYRDPETLQVLTGLANLDPGTAEGFFRTVVSTPRTAIEERWPEFLDLYDSARRAGGEAGGLKTTGAFISASFSAQIYRPQDHWYWTVEKPLRVYQAHLLKPEAAPVRDLFLERYAGKQDVTGIEKLLNDHPVLDLDQRLALYRSYETHERPDANYQLVLAGLGAGNDQSQALELNRRFFEAAESARIYTPDDHWYWTVEKPLKVYQDHLLRPEAAPVRDLFLERYAWKQDVTGLEKLLDDQPGLDLDQRVALYRSFETHERPDAAYQLVLAGLRAGNDQSQALELNRRFFEAAESARIYTPDDHWQWTVEKPLRVYQDRLLKPEAAPVRDLFLERYANKQDVTGLEKLLNDQPGLDLDQRVDLYRSFETHERPDANYQLVLAGLRAGNDRDQALELNRRFFEAAESARIYTPDDHWQWTVEKPLRVYQDHLLKPEAAPVRDLFLHRYAAKMDTTGLEKLLTPQPGMDLEERVALYRSFQNDFRPVERYQLVAEGIKSGVDEARAFAVTQGLFQGFQDAREYASDDDHWTWTVEPHFNFYKKHLFKGPNSSTGVVLEICLESGFNPAAIPAQLDGLMAKIEQARLTPEEIRAALPAAGRTDELGAALESMLDLHILYEDQKAPDPLEVEVGEEEVVVGDFVVDRKD